MNRDLLKLLTGLFLQDETDIVNEIGRLRSRGLTDYHAEAALERVQAILRKLENDCWKYVPNAECQETMSPETCCTSVRS